MTAVTVSSVFLLRRHHRAPEAVTGPLLGGLLVLVAVLKGTTPGGRRARRAFEAARRGAATADSPAI